MGILSWLGLKPDEPETPSPTPRPDKRFSLELPPEMTGLPALGVAPRISRREALQVPAVLRSRNLIAGSLATLPIRVHDHERRVVSGTPGYPPYLLPQPDPDLPQSVMIAQTVEDLFFEGVSWWHVTKFGWHGYPVAARHVPHTSVTVHGSAWPAEMLVSPDQYFPVDGDVYIDGVYVPDSEIIRFDSPNPPLLLHAARAIRTCLLLDQAAALYSKDPLPLGVFTQREGADPASEPEIQAVLDAWEEARATRAWGFVNSALEAKTLQWDPKQLQLAEARQHAVLEIARAAGIDPEDLGVSTTSRTYQNSEQRRQDLIDFTLGAYVSAMQDRLSMRDVLPRGYVARIDFGGFLRGDTKTRVETYKTGLEVGAYTQEEVRELENRPPLTPAEKARAAPRQEKTMPETAQLASQLPYGPGSKLWDYWTKGEGKAKWIGAVHKWRTLRALLIAAGVPAHSVNGLTTNIIQHVLPGYMKSTHDDADVDVTFSDPDPSTTTHLTFGGEHVDAAFRVHPDQRTISGLLMPWDQVGRSAHAKYSFARDSLSWVDVKRVKLFRDHDYTQAVGRAIRLESTDAGLDATFKIARGADGDKVLALAEDGVLDGLSAGVDFETADAWSPHPADETVRYVQAGILREGSLTALPAFDGARISSVAATREGRQTMEKCLSCGQEHAAGTPCATSPAPTAVQASAAPTDTSFTQLTEAITKMGTAAEAQQQFNASILERLTAPQGGRETVPAGRVQAQVREEPVYTFSGHGPSLVRDSWHARIEGNPDARERLLKFGRQQQDMVSLAQKHPEIGARFAVDTTSGANVIPPGYRPDLYVTQLLQGRPLVDSVSKGALSDATPFVLPSFGSATNASSDHAEGVNPTGGALVINSVTVTPGATSGLFQLTREIVDSANPAIDAIAMQAMRESYSQQTEAKLYAELNGVNGQGGVITAGFVPSGAQVSVTESASAAEDPTFGGASLLAGVRNALALYPFRRFAAPNKMHLSQEGTSAFAAAVGTDGRPLLPSTGATNTAGVGNAQSQGWFVDGLAAMPTWSMSGNAAGDADVLIYNSQDVWAWESPLLTFRFEERNGPALIELALFGYFATRLIRPRGLAAIRHAAVFTV